MANLPENYSDLTLRTQEALGLDTLIETGSFGGLSAVWAADHFSRVVSIDVRSENQVEARERCSGKTNVEWVVGDSRQALRPVVESLSGPAFFWLDAHEEAGKFGQAKDDCPVLEELEIINASPFKHAILIDDAHCFEAPYDPAVWPRVEQIEAVVRRGGYELRQIGHGLLVLPPEHIDILDGNVGALAKLAKHFADMSQWDMAADYARAGITIPGARGKVHRVLAELHSAVSWHCEDGLDRREGERTAEFLALSEVPLVVRLNARCNLAMYARGLHELAPSFQARRLEVECPEGFHPHNPSIVARQNAPGFFCTVRLVDYTVGIPKSPPYVTRNLLLALRPDLSTAHSSELLFEDPSEAPIRGMEDIRLFWRGDQLYGVGTCYLNSKMQAQIVVARVAGDRLVEWESPKDQWPVGKALFPQRAEKNWQPLLDGQGKRFVYSVDPTIIVDTATGETAVQQSPVMAENWKGGSQAIPYDDGWLMIVHETDRSPELNVFGFTYQHRFAWFDRDLLLTRLSPRFYLGERSFQFVCGLARAGERLVISYGANCDNEAWLGTMAVSDLEAMLRPATAGMTAAGLTSAARFSQPMRMAA